MTESKFCTKCGANLVIISQTRFPGATIGDKVCLRLYEYWMKHPTLPSVSHSVLPREETPEPAAMVGVLSIGETVEVPPSPRLCTSCEQPNIGWCPHCKRTFCAKQDCMLQHESVCPGFKLAMQPIPEKPVDNIVPKQKHSIKFSIRKPHKKK